MSRNLRHRISWFIALAGLVFLLFYFAVTPSSQLYGRVYGDRDGIGLFLGDLTGSVTRPIGAATQASQVDNEDCCGGT